LKLGTILLRDAIISLGQLEAGLRAQVLYGGKLGTNLVELGFVDLDTLGTYLGRITGLPVASKDHFENAPAESIAHFERGLAELYMAFPLGADRDTPEALAVAVADPSDQTSLEQLAAQCECPIVPYIAPELRIYFYLEKHFDVERKARFVRAGTRRELHSMDDRRRSQPPHGIEMPPVVRFEPTRKPDAAPAPAEPPKLPERPAPHSSFDEIIDTFEAATTRDQIGRALTEFAVGRFDACVVFLLRDANALGWRVYTVGNTSSRADIETLSLPLGGASALQAAHDSRATYRGSAPAAGKPIETKLWKAIGTIVEPGEMLVVPVLVKARVVNLIYVHNEGPDHLFDAHVEEITRVGQHASAAYLRLIQDAKNGARADE
jgi:hypothetical protein